MEKFSLTDIEVSKIISDYFRKNTNFIDLSISIGTQVTFTYTKDYKGVIRDMIYFLTFEEYLTLLKMVLTMEGKNVVYISAEKFYDNEKNPYMIFTIYENTLKRTRRS